MGKPVYRDICAELESALALQLINHYGNALSVSTTNPVVVGQEMLSAVQVHYNDTYGNQLV